ncbi:MAG: histidinol-phosphate transaminase [Nitrospirota bacterium]
MDIKKLVRPNVRSLSAYEAKEIPCRIKLDANESPYGLSSELLSKLSSPKGQRFFKNLNRYPDPEAKSLRELVSRDFRVRAENVLHGNGSDELIYYLITTFGGPVIYQIPTFSMYGIISRALGEEGIEVPLDGDFDLDIKKNLEAIKRHRPKLIFLSSPNNPTGNCFSADRILRIIDAGSSVSIVIVDEAYQPFSSRKGFLPLLRDYKNLVILRTLSKIGFAGLRVGFIIADEEIINEVNKVRLPFNLNSLSQSIAEEAIKEKKATLSYIRSITSERDRLFNEMTKINSIKPFPSEANFILFKVRDAENTYKSLLKKGILVRNMNGIVNGCLRVTVGTPEENTVFLEVLKEVSGG